MIHANTFNNNIDFNGAKGFVFIGEKMLCYRRDGKTTSSPFMIDLPGGRREGNESPFETFAREAKEEFGIEIKKEDIVYTKTHKSVVEPDKESYFFIAKLSSDFEDKIVFGNEGLEFLLLSVDDYLGRNDVIERHKPRLREYLQNKDH